MRRKFFRSSVDALFAGEAKAARDVENKSKCWKWNVFLISFSLSLSTVVHAIVKRNSHAKRRKSLLLMLDHILLLFSSNAYIIIINIYINIILRCPEFKSQNFFLEICSFLLRFVKNREKKKERKIFIFSFVH